MRILCFHLNQIGDLAFALPALKCIRHSFPDAHITSVVRPSMKEVMESTGLLDEVVSRRGAINLDKLGLARTLASRKPDLAVVFSQSAECALLAYLSRAPKRIGFVNTSLGFLLTSRIEFYHPPSTENNLRLVKSMGCEITCRDYSGLLRATREQSERANAILQAAGIGPNEPIAVLAPGTSGRRSVKEWTDEGFAAVGRHLAGRGLRPVILGTVPASSIVKEYDGIIDLSGKTDLGEVVAILARSNVLIAVDSGVLHLCAAVGTGVVGLYGSSNPAITGPQGDGHIVLTSGADCSPCIRTECSLARKCMTNLTPDCVISAIDAILERDRSPSTEGGAL
jgi:heptosyltransferase-1